MVNNPKSKLMKVLSFFSLLVLFLISIKIDAQVVAVEATDNAQRLQSVDGLQIHVLSNGLKVVMMQDLTQNQVFGAIAVLGGSKLDPKEASGTAHYFEHMMFKGSRNIGTVDYEAEKPYLDTISDLYELLRLDRDNPDFRKRILQKIDSFSVLASAYAIPNEFSKVMASMGGTGLNAYTSYENIVYHNKFPQESMMQWAELNYDRFANPVFRLFQSELETVYEEKNMSMDNFMRQAYEKLYANFYKGTAYGDRTILGSISDLKSPSIVSMMTYWKEYYAAQNMVVVLVGNFEPGPTIDILENTLGKLHSGSKAPMPVEKSEAIKGRKVVTEKIAPVPFGVLAFKGVEKTNKDKAAIDMALRMLSNSSSTGFLDTLTTDQSLMGAFAFQDNHYDMGGIFVFYIPKPLIQSLSNGEKKVMKAIEKLKNGAFTEAQFEAIKVEVLTNHLQAMEGMEYPMHTLIDAWMSDKLDNPFGYTSDIKELKREDIIRVANQYFTNDFLSFRSKIGLGKKTKLDKPVVSPLNTQNKNSQSEMAKQISASLGGEIIPQFVDFNDQVVINEIRTLVTMYQVNNPKNPLFNVQYRIGVGSENNSKYEQLAYYLDNSGTRNLSKAEFSYELQKLGSQLSIWCDDDYFYINLSGFNDRLNPSLLLLNQLLTQTGEDKKLVDRMVKDRKMENKMFKSDLSVKMDLLSEYSAYGENSTYLSRTTLKEIKKMKHQEMMNLLGELMKWETEIHIVTSLAFEPIRNEIATAIPLSDRLKLSQSPNNRLRKSYKENQFFWLADKEAIQSHIKLQKAVDPLEKTDRTLVTPFNNYFGSGMNSLMFREAREFKSLAYSSYGYVSLPLKMSEPGTFTSFMSTQADKTVEATKLMLFLVDSMPIYREQIPSLSSYLLRSINAGTPSFRNKSYWISRWKRQGYDYDPRRDQLALYNQLSIDHISDFYKKYIIEQRHVLNVVGDPKRVELEKLKANHQFTEVKLEKLFVK